MKYIVPDSFQFLSDHSEPLEGVCATLEAIAGSTTKERNKESNAGEISLIAKDIRMLVKAAQQLSKGVSLDLNAPGNGALMGAAQDFPESIEKAEKILQAAAQNSVDPELRNEARSGAHFLHEVVTPKLVDKDIPKGIRLFNAKLQGLAAEASDPVGDATPHEDASRPVRAKPTFNIRCSDEQPPELGNHKRLRM